MMLSLIDGDLGDVQSAIGSADTVERSGLTHCSAMVKRISDGDVLIGHTNWVSLVVAGVLLLLLGWRVELPGDCCTRHKRVAVQDSYIAMLRVAVVQDSYIAMLSVAVVQDSYISMLRVVKHFEMPLPGAAAVHVVMDSYPGNAPPSVTPSCLHHRLPYPLTYLTQ